MEGLPYLFMCGRYTITGDADRYADYFGVEEVRTASLEASYNVAPTDQVYAVRQAEGRRLLEAMSWGLPSWSEVSPPIRINARAETIASRPLFAESFRRRRCLLPADGFYEWERLRTGRQAHYFYAVEGHPLGFAGIWSPHPASDGSLATCAVVTSKPDPVVAPFHGRMPVILTPHVWDGWLDPDTTTDDLLTMLEPAPASILRRHLVSSLVNSVRNNSPLLIEPAADPTEAAGSVQIG